MSSWPQPTSKLEAEDKKRYQLYVAELKAADLENMTRDDFFRHMARIENNRSNWGSSRFMAKYRPLFEAAVPAWADKGDPHKRAAWIKRRRSEVEVEAKPESGDGSDDDESEEEEDDEDDVDISSSPRFKPQAASSPRRRKRYRPDSDDEDEHSAAISMGPRNALDQNGVGVNGTHPPRIRLRTSLPANAALRHDAADHPVAGPSSRANGHHDPHALDIERLRQTAEYREKCAQVMELEHDVETMRQAAAEKDKRHQAELERVRETHMGLVMRMTNEHAAELERLRTTLPLPHVGQEGMKEGLEVEKRRIRVEMEKEYAAQLEKEKAEMRTSIEREVRRELEADAAPREVQDDHRRLRASLEAERAEKERLKTRIIELQDRVIQMSDEARRGA